MNDTTKIAPAIERLRGYASDKQDVQIIPTYDLQKWLQSYDALVAALRQAWNAAEGMRHTPDAEIAKAWGQLADKWSAALAAAEKP